MLNKLKQFFCLMLVIFLVGCATQKNIQLPDNFWKNPKHKITVSTTKTLKPHVYQIGPQGALDYVIHVALNNNLDNYLGKSDLTWYQHIPLDFAARLKKRNIYAKAYLEQLEEKQLAYINLANQTNSDKLLIIKLEALGARREYYSLLPLHAPEAYCVISGELIDVKNHQVLWRHRATVNQRIEGVWDEPPGYPHLTEALQVAVNTAQQELLDNFFS